MLKVCIVVDTEGLVSFKQLDPVTKDSLPIHITKKIILNILKFVRYDKNGFKKMHAIAVQEQFPISFMLVENKFKPISSEPFIDWGSHTTTHKPLTFVSNEQLKTELENKRGAFTFSPPMSLIEDPAAPDRIFKQLYAEGYRISLYADPIIRDAKTQKIIVLKNPTRKIQAPINRFGIKCVYVSNTVTGRDKPEQITNLLADIRANSMTDAVYCITTHDFDNRDLDNFKKLISELKKMKVDGAIELVNLKQV